MAWFHPLPGSWRRDRNTHSTCRKARLALELLEARTLLAGDPFLSVALASHTFAENAGPAATTGTVSRNNMDVTQALTVNLRSSDTTQAAVPATVTIPAGASSATFNVDAVDNGTIDPPRTVTITGWALSPLAAGLDTTFGSAGRASVSLKVSSSANFPDVAVQADGKIVAVAATPSSGATWAVARVLASGAPDPAFGAGGTVVTTFPGSTGGYASGVTIQPDGKVVVVGTVNGTSAYDAWGIARYNTDGTPDATFGTGGLVLIKFTGEAGWLYDAAILSNGEILVGGMRQDPSGFAVARLTSTGRIDTSFGTSGFASVNPEPGQGWYNTTGQAMTVQADGKILLTGIANYNALPVARLNANGTPDTTFNGTGVKLIPLSALGAYTSALGTSLAVQADGKVLVTGTAVRAGSNYSDFVTARLNPDGSLDTSFNHTGVITTNFANGDNQAHDVAVQVDGKIIVGGQVSVIGTGFFVALARYNADGTPDTTFNGTGKLTTRAINSFDAIWGIALQADGKLDAIAGYNTTMYVTRYDTGLLTAADSVVVTDSDTGPTARAGGPYHVPEGGTVQLDASATTEAYPGSAAALSYAWDFDNDGIYGQTGASAPRGDEIGIYPTFSAAGLSAGPVVVHLRVTDSFGVVSYAEALIQVTDVTVSVNAGGDATLNDGDTLVQHGTFTDPGADSWTATVDYGDGSGAQPLTLNADKTFTLIHSYTDEGVYKVVVTVTAGDQAVGTSSFNVTVNEITPVVLAGANATIHEGTTFARAGSFTDTSPDTWMATIDYGDGSGVQPLAIDADRRFSLSHLYQDEGTYTVTVVVTDADNTASTGTLTVTVDDPAPAVSAGSNTTIHEGTSYSGSGAFTDPGADTWTATVDYGDGSGAHPLTLNADKSFNLSHLYTDEGSYTVTVAVTDDEGVVGTGTFTVTVDNPAPVVSAGANATLNEGSSLIRSGSFADPGSDTWTATVDYGDGSGVQALTLNANKTFALNHAYTEEGSYTVNVSVTDDHNVAGTATFAVNVQDIAPNVNAGADQSLNEGNSFVQSGSFSDPSGDASWTATVDYGDGSGSQPLTLNADRSFTLGHAYRDEGTYKVLVTVTDDENVSGVGTFNVTVNNPAPVVNAGSNTTIHEGTSYSGSGAFTDAGADTWTATVDYGDGSGAQALTLNADKSFSLGHTYADEGTYTVTVTVADDEGVGGTSTFTITVDNPAPVVSLTSNQTVNEGNLWTGGGSFADPGADTWAATVDYGDGSGVQALTLSANKTFNLSHSYSDEGSYTVTVTVTDDDNISSSATLAVQVNDPAPVVNVGPDLTLNEGDAFARSGVSFSDPGADTWTATVDYGDGSGAQPLTLNTDKSFSLGHTYKDEGTYSVTVTVTDDEHVAGTGTFHVTVNNVVPVVNVGSDLPLNEGDAFGRSGLSFNDPSADTWTATVNYGDGSGVQPLTLNADKTFSLGHAYTDNGAYTVTVVVTDDDNLAGSATFHVTVNNVAPTATLVNNGPVAENSPVTVSFVNPYDPSPVDTQAGLHYSFALAPAQLATSYAAAIDGASRSFVFPDGPASPVVYGRIFDKDGGYSDYQTTVTVNDVPPTVAVAGPASGVRGQAQTFTITAQDPSPVDQAAGFAYTVSWGDNTTTAQSGPGSVALSHVFTAAGTYTVKVWATDKDGLQSVQPATQTITVSAAALQAGDLIVGGTTANDTIVLKPADRSGNIAVVINGAAVGTYHPTGQIVVYAQAGDDNIQLQTARISGTTVLITVPAILFGGDGNDTINTSGSSANNILSGGAGNDTLQGGNGRNILIGGTGADVLHGGSGDDILIAGTTDYDNNLAALAAFRAEWTRTDLAYLDRINHLDGAVAGGRNGGYVLNRTTVHDDSAIDQLYGEGGADWFFAMTGGSHADVLGDRRHDETVTAIG